MIVDSPSFTVVHSNVISIEFNSQTGVTFLSRIFFQDALIFTQIYLLGYPLLALALLHLCFPKFPGQGQCSGKFADLVKK